MNSSKLILALWLGANAWAQTSPQRPVVPPVAATSPVPKLPAVAKPGAPSAPMPQNTKAPSATASTKAIPPAKAAARKPYPPQAAKPSARLTARSSRRQGTRSMVVQPQSRAVASTGSKPGSGKMERDPFVSPVVEHVREGVSCNGTGRQCLSVADINLRGVVRCTNGYIAVVANGERTYFLRENDPLADGAVERITRDAIVLRERSSDTLGRPLTREVTKRLGVVPAV